jgi:hypothetical protein
MARAEQELGMKSPFRRDPFAGRASDLADEMRVSAVFDAAEPLWYVRLTARFRLTWRRELATVIVVFLAGILVGLVLARS